jgi:hypothetical protein
MLQLPNQPIVITLHRAEDQQRLHPPLSLICNLIEINLPPYRILSMNVTMFIFAIESVFIILCCSDERCVSSSLNLRRVDLYVLAKYNHLLSPQQPAPYESSPSIEIVHKFSSDNFSMKSCFVSGLETSDNKWR